MHNSILNLVYFDSQARRIIGTGALLIQ
jgi:hypothetical protein